MKTLILSFILLAASVTLAQQQITITGVTIGAQATTQPYGPALTHSLHTASSKDVLEALKTMKPAYPANEIQADKHPNMNWWQLMFRHSE